MCDSIITCRDSIITCRLFLLELISGSLHFLLVLLVACIEVLDLSIVVSSDAFDLSLKISNLSVEVLDFFLLVSNFLLKFFLIVFKPLNLVIFAPIITLHLGIFVSGLLFKPPNLFLVESLQISLLSFDVLHRSPNLVLPLNDLDKLSDERWLIYLRL